MFTLHDFLSLIMCVVLCNSVIWNPEPSKEGTASDSGLDSMHGLCLFSQDEGHAGRLSLAAHTRGRSKNKASPLPVWKK